MAEPAGNGRRGGAAPGAPWEGGVRAPVSAGGGGPAPGEARRPAPAGPPVPGRPGGAAGTYDLDDLPPAPAGPGARPAGPVAGAGPGPAPLDRSAARGEGGVSLPTLTPAGRAVLGGSVVLYAVGWGLGYVEVLTVAAAGLLALLVAVGWTWTRPRLEVDRSVHPQRVVRGDRADARLRVTNPTGRTLQQLTAVDMVGDRDVAVALPRVPAGETGTTGYRLPTERRGVIDVGPLRVIRQDPLGLLETARQYGVPETLWIYPKIYPVSPLSAGRQRDLEGPTSDGAAGSITFHALREYVIGDDLRLIHWRSTARTGTLMLRQQADPSQPQMTIVLDTQVRSYDEETFEAAVEAAASLVTASTTQRFPVRLFTGTGLVATGRGSRATASALLDHLTPLQRSEDGNLAAVAARLATEPGGHSLVVITGDPDPTDVLAVETLRHRYDMMAVVRFRADAEPGVSWDHGVIDLIAPDGEAFAALWNRRAS